VLANVRDIMEPFGAISSVSIVDSEASPTLGVGDGEMSEGKPVIVVKFIEAAAAAAAARSIDGMLVGGEPIQVLLRDDAHPRTLQTDVRMDLGNTITETSAVVVVREGTTGSFSEKGAYVLYLENLVAPGDVADEAEATEVLNDLLSLCGVFGDITSVWIDSLPASASPLPAAPATAAPRDDPPLVLLECLTLADALMVSSSLRDAVLGKWGIDAQIFDYSAYQRGDLRPDGIIRLCDGERGFAVQIQDFAYVEQLADDDERQQLVMDVLDLVYPGGTPDDNSGVFFIEHGALMVDVVVPLDSLSLVQCMDLMGKLEAAVVAGDRLHASLLILGVRDQLAAAVGREVPVPVPAHVWAAVGARTLQAGNVHPTAPDSAKNGALVVVQHYLSKEDLEGFTDRREGVAVAKEDLLQSIRSRISGAEGAGTACFIRRVSISTEIERFPDVGSRLVACAGFPDLFSAESAMLRLDGSMIGGARVTASIAPLPAVKHFSSAGTAADGNGAGADATNGCHAPTGTEATISPIGHHPTHPDSTNATPVRVTAPPAKVVSKYAESMGAPKLEKHTKPLMPVKQATEECEGWVRDFLGAIATFQERAKEKDPIRAAAKKRFVLGIKQVNEENETFSFLPNPVEELRPLYCS
jgi:hypothetical protein